MTKNMIKPVLFSILLFPPGSNKAQIENRPEQPFIRHPSTNSDDPSSGHGKNIDCIIQDRKNYYWLASNGEGVYRFDGQKWKQYTVKDGLCSNFVWSIQEDINGILWFSTRDGVCSFNGTWFTDHTDKINRAPLGTFRFTKGGLFFSQLNGLCYYDGKTFTAFSIAPDTYRPSPYNMNRPYRVYSTLVDKNGNMWFGTQEKGVCRYDGHSFTFYTEEGLDKAAVRTLFQDKAGTLWAGNNGAGLFTFNGKAFVNFTDQKGLSNRDFLRTLKGKEGTLARPWTLNEDDRGNLWIGTIDAGLWRYDNSNLTNYTTKDGLPGNSIWASYKNKNGQLLFVVNGESIFSFHHNNFIPYVFH